MVNLDDEDDTTTFTEFQMGLMEIDDTVLEMLKTIVEKKQTCWGKNQFEVIFKSMKKQKKKVKTFETLANMQRGRAKITNNVRPSFSFRLDKHVEDDPRYEDLWDANIPIFCYDNCIISRTLLILPKIITEKLADKVCDFNQKNKTTATNVIDHIMENVELEYKYDKVRRIISHKKARSHLQHKHQRVFSLIDYNDNKNPITRYFENCGAFNNIRTYYPYLFCEKELAQKIKGVAIPSITTQELVDLYQLIDDQLKNKDENTTVLIFQFLNLDWILPKLPIGICSEKMKKENRKRKKKEEKTIAKQRKRKRKEEKKIAKQRKCKKRKISHHSRHGDKEDKKNEKKKKSEKVKKKEKKNEQKDQEDIGEDKNALYYHKLSKKIKIYRLVTREQFEDPVPDAVSLYD